MAYIKSQLCSIWRYDNTASPLTTYAQIGQVTSISGPDGSVPEVDVTHLSSTGKEYVGGLADFGSVTCEVIFDAATTTNMHEQIWTDFLAQTVTTYQIRLSDSPATTITFTGYPNQYSYSLGVDEAVRATIGFKVSGAPTLVTP
jgi:hypothetical protein